MRTKHVVVKKYDPLWKEAFLTIKEYLYQEIPKRFKIEHVGSTSVEGLCAKPIIDIDIVYHNEEDKEMLIKRLSKLGYEHEGDLGITGREAFKYKVLPFMKHHTYVVKEDTKAYQDHIALREYLSVHEQDKQRYGDVKMKFAAKYPYDIDAYCEGKSPCIQEIMKKASLWMMENTQ